MATPVFVNSKLLVALLALACAVIVALSIGLAASGGGGGSVAAPQSPPAAKAPAAGGAITLHQSQSTSRVTVDGRTATGESVTSVGKPGASVKGTTGKNGTTGSAKGGDGGSASAKGGSATSGSVVVQTTTP